MLLCPSYLSREELIGNEGYAPPILLKFTDFDGSVSFYWRESLDHDPVTSGPMFGKDARDDIPALAFAALDTRKSCVQSNV